MKDVKTSTHEVTYDIMSRERTVSYQRVWLITGASSGFGRDLTEFVLNKGDIAVATLRNPTVLDELARDGKNSDRLLVLRCDVTNPYEISDVFARTIARFGHCDVVFNNAGRGILGEVEGTPVLEKEADVRKLFEVNFWGAANVSREAVRVFREINPPGLGGRLLTVTSGGGLVGGAALGYYCASKHALEGLTEALSKELDPAWNIKISLLEPGAFKTRALTENIVTLPVHPAYNANTSLPSHQVRRWVESRVGITGDPYLAAERIFEFAALPNPPLRLVLGNAAFEEVVTKLNSVHEELQRFKSWSDGLEAGPYNLMMKARL